MSNRNFMRRGLGVAPAAERSNGFYLPKTSCPHGGRSPSRNEEKFAVADHVVAQLKQHGDPWELSEEAKPNRGHRRSDSTW